MPVFLCLISKTIYQKPIKKTTKYCQNNHQTIRKRISHPSIVKSFYLFYTVRKTSTHDRTLIPRRRPAAQDEAPFAPPDTAFAPPAMKAADQIPQSTQKTTDHIIPSAKRPLFNPPIIKVIH